MCNLKQIIPNGKENGIHQSELAERLGVNRSTVQKMVHDARINGIPILSGRVGYYFAKNDAEKREFIAWQSQQAYTRLSTIKPIRVRDKGIKGQMSLFDDISELIKELKE